MGRNRRKNRISTVTENHNLHANDMPFNGHIVTDVVDNPHDVGPEKIPVARSIRDDPLAGMLSRGSIDRAQFSAGRRWQFYFETAAIGSVIAIDPLKEPVDGQGASRADFTDEQLHAFRQLEFARLALGGGGDLLVREVLGAGKPLQTIAAQRWDGSPTAIKYFGMRFRECLESLAQLWGYVASTHSNAQTKARRVRFVDWSLSNSSKSP